MKRRIGSILSLLILAALPAGYPLAQTPQEAIARVIIQKGEVSALDASGASRPLQRGAQLFVEETLVTGPDGYAQIRLVQDQMLISFQADTVFTFDEYEYDGPGGAGDTAIMTMLQGGFRTVSGSIGEEAGDTYRIDTPLASIGIRGTTHSAYLNPAGTVLITAVEDGGTRVFNTQGFVDLGVGANFDYSRTLPNQPPEGLLELPPNVVEIPIDPNAPDPAEDDGDGGDADGGADGAAALAAAGGDGDGGAAGGDGGDGQAAVPAALAATADENDLPVRDVTAPGAGGSASSTGNSVARNNLSPNSVVAENTGDDTDAQINPVQNARSVQSLTANDRGNDNGNAGGNGNSNAGGNGNSNAGGNDNSNAGGNDNGNSGNGNSNAGGNDNSNAGGNDNGNSGNGSSNAGGNDNSNAGGSDNGNSGNGSSNAGGNDNSNAGGSDNGNSGNGSSNAGGNDNSNAGGSDNGNSGNGSSNAGGNDNSNAGGSDNGNSGNGSSNAGGNDNGNAGGSDNGNSGNGSSNAGGNDNSNAGGSDNGTSGNGSSNAGGNDNSNAGGSDNGNSGNGSSNAGGNDNSNAGGSDNGNSGNGSSNAGGNDNSNAGQGGGTTGQSGGTTGQGGGTTGQGSGTTGQGGGTTGQGSGTNPGNGNDNSGSKSDEDRISELQRELAAIDDNFLNAPKREKMQEELDELLASASDSGKDNGNGNGNGNSKSGKSRALSVPLLTLSDASGVLRVLFGEQEAAGEQPDENIAVTWGYWNASETILSAANPSGALTPWNELNYWASVLPADMAALRELSANWNFATDAGAPHFIGGGSGGALTDLQMGFQVDLGTGVISQGTFEAEVGAGRETWSLEFSGRVNGASARMDTLNGSLQAPGAAPAPVQGSIQGVFTGNNGGNAGFAAGFSLQGGEGASLHGLGLLQGNPR